MSVDFDFFPEGPGVSFGIATNTTAGRVTSHGRPTVDAQDLVALLAYGEARLSSQVIEDEVEDAEARGAREALTYLRTAFTKGIDAINEKAGIE